MFDTVKKAQNLEELKKAYRKLSLKFHPDCGGSDSQMAELNNIYESMFEKLKNVRVDGKAPKENTETSADFIKIIDELIKYDDINIDIIGSWLWVGGNTFAIKEQLKALGFKWSKGKSKWYYTADVVTKKKRYGKKSYDDLKSIYGCETVQKASKKYLTA